MAVEGTPSGAAEADEADAAEAIDADGAADATDVVDATDAIAAPRKAQPPQSSSAVADRMRVPEA